MTFSVPFYCLDKPHELKWEGRCEEIEEYRNIGGMKLSNRKMESRTLRSYSLCRRVWLNRHINEHWKAGNTEGRNSCGREHQDSNWVRGDREMRSGSVLWQTTSCSRIPVGAEHHLSDLALFSSWVLNLVVKSRNVGSERQMLHL